MSLYRVLDVSRDATTDEIRKAYKAAAFKHHPDKGGDPDMFKQVAQAYDVLGDERRRAIYNQTGSVEAATADGATDAGDQGADLFDVLFGRATSFKSAKPADRRLIMRLSLTDAYLGKQHTLAITIDRPCKACTARCARCGGQGVTFATLHMGMIRQSMQQPCQTCSGTGVAVVKRSASCTTCGGKRRTEEYQERIIDIPPGARSGVHAVLHGLGEQRGSQSGDLVVELQVDDVLGPLTRQGDDIVYRHELALKDALAGTSIQVPHIEGPLQVDLREFGVIKPGKAYRIEGKGMPSLDGKGDLLLMFDIAFPSASLDEEGRDEITQLFMKLGLDQ